MNNRLLVCTLLGLVSLFGIAGVSSAAPFVNGSITLYMGHNISSGPWTIQLQDLANIGNATNAPGAIAVFYNGTQYNETTLGVGQTTQIDVNGNLLYMYMSSSYSGTYSNDKWIDITPWYDSNVTYVGHNLTSGPWTVQLQDLAETSNGTSAPAAVAIYYNGQLTNESTINSDSIDYFNQGGNILYLEANSTFSGLYAYQKWAKLEAWSSPAVEVSELIETGLPDGSLFTAEFGGQTMSALVPLSDNITFVTPANAEVNYTLYSTVYNGVLYTPSVDGSFINVGGATIIAFTPASTTTTTTIPPNNGTGGGGAGPSFIKLMPGQEITDPWTGITIQLVNATQSWAEFNVFGATSSTHLVNVSFGSTVQVMVNDTSNVNNGTDFQNPVNISYVARPTTAGQYWAGIRPITASFYNINVEYFQNGFGDWYVQLVNNTPSGSVFNVSFYHYNGGVPCISPACSKMFGFNTVELGSIDQYTFSNATSNYTMYLYLNSSIGNWAKINTWQTHYLLPGINTTTTTTTSTSTSTSTSLPTTTATPTTYTKFTEVGLPKGANFTVTYSGITEGLQAGSKPTSILFATTKGVNGTYALDDVTYKGTTYKAILFPPRKVIAPGSSVTVVYYPIRVRPTTTTTTTTVRTTTTTIRPTTTTVRPTTTTVKTTSTVPTTTVPPKH